MILIPRSLHPHLKWWLEEDNVLQGQHYTHSNMLCKSLQTHKRGVGPSLRGTHCKGNLQESKLHINYLELKTVFLAPKRIPRPLLEQHSSHSHRQHHSAYINKEEGGEVRSSVCPSVENPDLVLQETGNSQSPTHSRPDECGSRPAIQARLDHPNTVVSPPRGLPISMQQVASTSDRPIRGSTTN